LLAALTITELFRGANVFRVKTIGIGAVSGLWRSQLSSLRDIAWRTAFRIGFPLARIWWRLARSRGEGALVAIYVGSELLLVRSSYRVGWHLPGGGVRRHESPEAAARRELAEEIGLTAAALHPADVICGSWEGRRGRVHFFEMRLRELPKLKLDNREIIAARLISTGELHSMAVSGPLAAYLAGRQPPSLLN
jgi:8-oxo-dGTP diphosphatase